MVSYGLAVLGIAAATLIPVYIALYTVSLIRTRYLAAVAVGLAFWFFFDTLNGAAQLDVNEGFSGGLDHIAIVVVFAAEFILIAVVDHIAVPRKGFYSSSGTDKVMSYLFLIPLLTGLAMGFHALGEGWDFASAAAVAGNVPFVQAFGGNSAAIAYILHKFFEATIIATIYSMFVGRGPIKKEAWHLPVLGIVFGGQSIIGAAVGYYVPFDTTYLYSFGVASAFYAVIRASEALDPSFQIGENHPFHLGWQAFLALAIGFLLLYSAALLHS